MTDLAVIDVLLVALVVGAIVAAVAWYCANAIHDDFSELGRGVRDGDGFRRSGVRRAWPEDDSARGDAA